MNSSSNFRKLNLSSCSWTKYHQRFELTWTECRQDFISCRGQMTFSFLLPLPELNVHDSCFVNVFKHVWGFVVSFWLGRKFFSTVFSPFHFLYCKCMLTKWKVLLLSVTQLCHCFCHGAQNISRCVRVQFNVNLTTTTTTTTYNVTGFS